MNQLTENLSSFLLEWTQVISPIPPLYLPYISSKSPLYLPERPARVDAGQLTLIPTLPLPLPLPLPLNPTLTLPLTRTPTLTPTLTPTPTLTQELEDDVRSVYAAYPEPWRVQVKGGG